MSSQGYFWKVLFSPFYSSTHAFQISNFIFMVVYIILKYLSFPIPLRLASWLTWLMLMPYSQETQKVTYYKYISFYMQYKKNSYHKTYFMYYKESSLHTPCMDVIGACRAWCYLTNRAAIQTMESYLDPVLWHI